MKWNKINGFHDIIDSCFCSKVKTAQIHTHEQNTTNHIVRNKCTSTSFCFFKIQTTLTFSCVCYEML